MGKTRFRINSWSASHEEKLRHVPQKFKDKIEENLKTQKKGLQRKMITDGGDCKKLKHCFVVENIKPQMFLENVMK